MALTDHLRLTGAVEFYLACKEEDIKPILGLEIDIQYHKNLIPEESGSLVLLAMDIKGWASLCQLSSFLNGEKFSQSIPTCSIENLAHFSDHLICLSGGYTSLLQKMISRHEHVQAIQFLSDLRDLFPNRFYVELQLAGDDNTSGVYEIARLAQQLSLPVVATQNIYFLERSQTVLLQTLTAIRLNLPIENIPADKLAPKNGCFIDENELTARFSHLPSALASIQKIVNACQLELPVGKPNFPNLPLPMGSTGMDVLRQKAYAGAEKRYGNLPPEIRDKLEQELDVIGKSGYESIFLITEELLSFARKSDILFSSRGSAASSLVAYCLGITTPDPIKLDLFFERFLNPARTTPPDIDTDICSRNREKVIQHVFEVYTSDRAAMVGTINTYRPRSALSDVAKAHGLSLSEIRKLVANLPYRYFGPDDEENDQLISPFTEIAKTNSSRLHRKIFGEATAILGFPRHLSIHAGGVVVAPGNMTDLVPTQLSGQKGVVITQFDLVSLEKLGLVKIDLLGIRGLTVLSDVIDSIRTNTQKVEIKRFELLESIPAEDEPTSTRIEKGQTIGCFQIESPGMRKTLREINARSIDDVMAALALYRPGPLKGGYKDAFVRRHRGEEPSQFFHPRLAPFLRDTYGVIVYQEQVMRIAHELAGLSITEADLLRRAMSHFDPGKQMQLIKEHFIQGAMEKSEVDRELSGQIWDLMAAFAGYGFPKAHAASYALFSWRSAWCKTHFPAEFMAAVMANWGGYYSQQVYLTEAKRIGLDVRAPHINYSQKEFSVTHLDGKRVLFMGLDQVRDLTSRTQQKIIKERPFSTLKSFPGHRGPATN